MKKYLTIILLSSFCSIGLMAQNLVSGEYFFDTDPGVGNAIALPSFSPNDTINSSLNILTTGLSIGFHNLFIRYKDSNSKWGIYEGRTFYVSPANTTPSLAADIVTAEYFFDTDPGVGNAIALPSFSPSDTINSTLALPTTGLSTGFHHLFIRYKDSDNKWGIYEGRTFYVSPANTTPSLAADIVTAEYFFNTDPGVGNGTALAAFSPSDTINSNLNISVSGLATGTHHLFIRYKDADNKWGIYEGREFEVVNCNVPIADFSVSATNVCLGDTLFLTDNSSNIVAATTFAWDYDNDGSIESTTAGNQAVYINSLGSHTIKLKLDHLGCIDSLITTVNVVPNYSHTNSASVCSGGSYTFADGTTQNNITSSISHTNNLQSIYGCDSIVVTTLSLNPTYNHTNSASVCSGDSYTFADGFTQSNITTSISHTNNLQSANSCDSIVVTTINLFPDYNTSENASICSGSSYTFPDGSTQNNITSPVSHTNSFLTINGCDSILITSISINPHYNTTENLGVCTGSSYTFPDGFIENNITSNLSHTSNLMSVNGCDSIIMTNINVTSNYNFFETVSICSGDSYTFPDGSEQTNITSQIVHINTLTGIGSCDTILETTINVNPTYNISETYTVCIGSSFTFPDGTVFNNITNTVSHTSYLMTINYCDSVLNTTINVNPVFSIPESVNLCSGSSYTFPDGTVQNNITTQLIYTSNFLSIDNCDSSIVTTININPIYNMSNTVNVCAGSSYTFPDGSIQNNITANVNHTSNLQTNNNCDSVINTILNITTTYNTTESVNICSGDSYSFPDGTIQNNIVSDLSYTSNISSTTSCDTTIVSNISVQPVYSNTEIVKLCSGDNYTLHDGQVLTNITQNTEYISSLISSLGCDSMITTQIEIENLTVSIFQTNNTLYTNDTNGQYQWINCENNQELLGETNSSFIPNTNGRYKLKFITSDGCIFYSECIEFFKVSIENFDISSIKIFPNPTDGLMILEFNDKTNDIFIKVIDCFGSVIIRKHLNSKKNLIDLSKMASGLYLIKILNHKNEIIKTVKVIRK